jgi:hypothetical protein
MLSIGFKVTVSQNTLLVCVFSCSFIKMNLASLRATFRNMNIIPNVFSSFVCVVSVHTLALFAFTAFRGLGFLDQEGTDVATVVLSRMNRGDNFISISKANAFLISFLVNDISGELPGPFLLALILPLLSTPAGVNSRAVKITTGINVCFLGATVYLLYRQSQTNSQTIGIIHDSFLAIALICVSYFACVPCNEEGDKLMVELSEGREADSILNRNEQNLYFKFCVSRHLHLTLSIPDILKNRVAGAASLLEMELERNKIDCRIPDTSLQQQALDQLYLTMKWCASRQILMDVASRRYLSVIAPVNIRKFIDEICFGNGRVRFDTSIDDSAYDPSGTKVLAFDKHMAILACENAVSNAKAHGDGDLIQFSVSFSKGLFAP